MSESETGQFLHHSMERKLEDTLCEFIPISQAMGIKVESASLEKIILWAPLFPNINHKKTVFGGSLHAVATLACWSLCHVNLSKCFGDHFQVVIVDSNISYLAPVDSDFKTECSMPEKQSWDRFIKMLQSKGKGRIHLHATIYHHEKLCVDYHSTFCALLK